MPTASNDAQGYSEKFYSAFHHCEATHFFAKGYG
ncbi:hypothetical protein [Lysinibacillus sp. FSL M8-0355]